MLKVGFLGSSKLNSFNDYNRELIEILEILFQHDDELVIITGGYRGVMEKISRLAKETKNKKNKLWGENKYQVNVIGILFDGYKNDPKNQEADYKTNQPNSFNDLYLSTQSVGERIQNLIQLSDIVIALPGSSGTLHEILHCIENIKYGLDYNNEINFNRLVLHSYWDEGKIRLFKENGIIDEEIYSQLKFWNSTKKHVLIDALDAIKTAENSFQFNNSPIPEITNSSLTILDLDNDSSFNSDEYIVLIRELNAHFQNSYISDKNHVIGLDIVIVDTEQEKLLRLTSICTSEYLVEINKFLNKNGSILSNIPYLKKNPSKFQLINLANLKLTSVEDSNRLYKLDFTEDRFDKTNYQTEFKDWQHYLQDKKVGKSVLWITLPALEEKYVISAFISFDIFVTRLSETHVKNIVTRFIYSKTLTELHNTLTKDLQQQAARAAISQVMARNLSHNHGSHVMSRLVTVEALTSYLNYKPQIELSSDEKFPFKNYKRLNLKGNNEHDGYQLFANFNSYQKTRMDFLADVTFGKPTVEMTKMFFSELMGDLDKNRILLENISGTNDFKYEFVVRNLTGCQNKQSAPCEDCTCCIINSENYQEKDIPVSIPNDILGCHAFYLIVENIIRNCAKHGAKKDGIRKILIDFDDSSREDDYYKVCIYDNSIPDKELTELVKEQNISLNRDVLEGNKLRQGGWGLIEMEAATAYLRKHELENINNKDRFKIDIDNEQNIYPDSGNSEIYKGSPNFLKAIGVHKFYGYRLFLLKPKEALIVYDSSASEVIDQIGIDKDILRKIGIKFAEIGDEKPNGFKSGEVYSYPILIFIGLEETYAQYIKNDKSSLPIRRLVCLTDNQHNNSRFALRLDKSSFSEIFNQEENFQVLNEIWKAWIIRQFKYLNIKINSAFYNPKENADKILLKNCPPDSDSLYFDDVPYVSFSDHAIDFCKFICETGDEESYAEPYNSKDYSLLGKLIRNDEKGFPKFLKEENVPLLCRLIEGTGTTIHVIDERIQELAENTFYKPDRSIDLSDDGQIYDLSFIDLLYGTHVIVPQYEVAECPVCAHCASTDENAKAESKSIRKVCNSRRFNLNAKDYTSNRQKIIDYLKSTIKTAGDTSHRKPKADFLLIHLGIIEKLISAEPRRKYDKDKAGIGTFMKEVILGKRPDKNGVLSDNETVDTKIIIISGRGKPHNLPEEFLYLNFSIIAQYCIENRLKYYLNNVVYSAKRI